MKLFGQRVLAAFEEGDEDAPRLDAADRHGWLTFQQPAGEPQAFAWQPLPWMTPQASRVAPEVQPLAGAAPVATNSTAKGYKNHNLIGYLQASDADPNTTLNYIKVSDPAHGTVVVNSSGSYTYSPNAGFSGSDSFTFGVNDNGTSGNASNTATVSLTVFPSSTAGATVPEINLAQYSGDIRVDSLLGFAPDWNFLRQVEPSRTLLVYTFDTSYSSTSASSTGRTGAVAAFSGAQQAAAAAILAHVSDETGIQFVLASSVAADGAGADIHFAAANVDFQPDDADNVIAGICLNSWGWSSFGDNVAEYHADSIVLLDNVQFAAENAAPAAGNDGYQILLHEIGHALGLTHPFEHLDGAGHPITALDLPTAQDDTNRTVMSYTWAGPNKSTFQSYDLLALRWIYGEDGLGGAWGFGSSNGPSLTLIPPNSAPTSSSTSISATEDQTRNGNLPTATDVETNPITYSRATNPAHGSVTVNANGSFSYVPAANYNGSDSFDFRVTDSLGAFNTYTVSITVAAVNDAPLLANAIADQNATALSAFSFAFAANTFSDIDNNTLSYSATLQGGAALPAWLSFTPATRSFSGTPGSGNVGAINVQVTANDGSLAASDVFVITVAAAANQAPVASNTTVNATEDQLLAGNLPAATDINGDPITYARTLQAGHGVVTVNANGSYSYSPAANYNGSDSFGYSVSDGSLANSYTVTVNVAAVNDAPVLDNTIADQGATAGAAFAFTLAADTFTDVDSLTLTYAAALQSGAALPAWLTFTPATRSFNGTAGNGDTGALSIRVTASDGSLSASDVFTLNVVQLNLPPVAADLAVGAVEDQTLAGQLPAAVDANGDGVVYARASQAAHGSVSVNANGSFSYTPAADYFGSDSFGYRVSDALGASNTYTVTISIAPVNDAPVARAAAATTAEDQALQGSALADDVDGPGLGFTLVNNPAHGTLQFQPDGAWRYVPAADYHGSDSFVFRASDGALNSAPATVGLIITPVNDAPTAAGASIATPEDTPLVGMLQAGDVDSPILTIIVVTPPQHGAIELLDGLAYRYLPALDYSGSDSFQFVARDGQLESAIATQSLTITPVNDAPVVAAVRSVPGIEDQTIAGTLDASDIDSTTISFSLAAPPAHGTLDLKPGGAWLYTPERDFFGSDEFSFRASDGQSPSGIGHISLAVQNVNDIVRGGVVILGELLVGQVLSVQSSLHDVDGLGSLRYRWLRSGQVDAVSTSAVYTPVAADIGRTLGVEVSYIDGGGSEERAAASTTGVIADSALLIGTPAGERLSGTALPESIDAGAGNDTLLGAAGNDTLDGGPGSDAIDGGDAFDTVVYRGRSSSLVASLAGGSAAIDGEFDLLDHVEALVGGSGNDRLEGDGAANRLDGGAGNDSISGGGGDDTLAPGAGNDTLDGGAGSDRVDYDGFEMPLRIELLVSAAGGGKGDVLQGIEAARGGWNNDTLLGGGGSQRLDGNAGDDSIAAGAGDDVLIGGLGADTIDGGTGFDLVVFSGNQPAHVDLGTGVGSQAGDEDLLIDLEAIVGSTADDFLVGRDDTSPGLAQVFRGGGGNDTLDGGAGVDQAQYRFARSEYQVLRSGDEISVAHHGATPATSGADGIDSLVRVERLLFADQYLAFGSRAEEVVRVAFVLWSPAIAASTTLFARGISFYDVGYDFRTLVETALFFHGDSDADLAAKLIVHTPGTTKTAAQLLALMAASGGGAAGRIAAVTEMANEPKTFEQVALAGFVTNGVACELNFIDTVLFAPLPPG